MTKSRRDYARTEAFVRAFSDEFFGIWGSTPFGNNEDELRSFCYFAACTCWLDSAPDDISSRRELMYRYLESDFSTANEDDTINELYQVLPVEESITRILRNLCNLYNKPARRKFGAKEKEFAALYDECQIDAAMRTAHVTARLTNNALIMPQVRNYRLEIDVLPPDLYRVVTDERDFRQVKELWIPISRKRGTVFHVWSKETYRKVEADGKEISIEPNRYGRIPGVFLQFKRSMTDYYGGAFIDLVFAALDSNKLKFMADNNVVYNGFAVWLAVNFGRNNTGLNLSPNRVIRVDDVTVGEGQNVEPDLRSISPSANYLEIEELRDVRYQRVLRNCGLPLSLYSPNPGVASGTALFLERMELMEIRSIDLEMLRSAERQLLELVTLVSNTDNATNLPETTIGVDYNDFEIIMEPEKGFALKKEQFEAGLIEAKDYVLSQTSNDLIDTNEKAIEFIKENLALVKEIKAENGNEQQNPNSPTGNTHDAGGSGNTTPEAPPQPSTGRAEQVL